MIKRIISIIFAILILSVCSYAQGETVTVYNLDGRVETAYKSDIADLREIGWYTLDEYSQKVTSYKSAPFFSIPEDFVIRSAEYGQFYPGMTFGEFYANNSKHISSISPIIPGMHYSFTAKLSCADITFISDNGNISPFEFVLGSIETDSNSFCFSRGLKPYMSFDLLRERVPHTAAVYLSSSSHTRYIYNENFVPMFHMPLREPLYAMIEYDDHVALWHGYYASDHGSGLIRFYKNTYYPELIGKIVIIYK